MMVMAQGRTVMVDSQPLALALTDETGRSWFRAHMCNVLHLDEPPLCQVLWEGCCGLTVALVGAAFCAFRRGGPSTRPSARILLLLPLVAGLCLPASKLLHSVAAGLYSLVLLRVLVCYTCPSRWTRTRAAPGPGAQAVGPIAPLEATSQAANYEAHAPPTPPASLHLQPRTGTPSSVTSVTL